MSTEMSLSNRGEREQAKELDLLSIIWIIMKVLGSLKITVTMFAFGIIILFVGTLAQDEETLVDVKAHYFNSWVAAVPLDVLKPVTIWPNSKRLPFVIPMPGGATIGLVLLVNLIMAKITRFTIRVSGKKMVIGSILTLIGFALIALVVIVAHLGDGLQGEPPPYIGYDALWVAMKASLFVMTGLSLMWALIWPPKTRLVYVISWLLFVCFAIPAVAIFVTGDYYRTPNPGLRIVWQLTKSFLVGGVLLAGLLMLFGKRGGNVLIHLGVGLLMLGQFIFGDQQVEERITLLEGRSTNRSYRIDEVELAVLESSSNDEQKVIAIGEEALKRTESGSYFKCDELPFEIKVVEWMDNSQFAEIDQLKENRATKGIGLQIGMVPIKKSGGAESEVNIVSAYVKIRDKGQNELGTYLLSQGIHDPQMNRNSSPEKIQVDGRTFELQFRFRETLKPYQISLIDVKRDDYTGTATPRNYSSDVQIEGDDGVSEQFGHIWMNNPLRFQGETFYQSQYMSPRDTGEGVEGTTLQVVTNAGWLIPYVSCVLVGLGMLVHFGGTLARFARRYDQSTAVKEPVSKLQIALPLIVGVLMAGFFGYAARPKSEPLDEIQWSQLGQLPMQHEGRIKPLDTVARNILQAVSNRTSTYEVKTPADESKKQKEVKTSATAVRWLVSLMAGEEWVLRSPCIRIDSKEVLQTLKLPDRDRDGHRFSYLEVSENIDSVIEILKSLDPRKEKSWTLEQQKHAQFFTRYQLMDTILYSYGRLIPDPPSQDAPLEEVNRFFAQIEKLQPVVERIESQNPPGIIPPLDDPEKGKWEASGTALFQGLIARLEKKPRDDSMAENMSTLLSAVKRKDPLEFSKALRSHREAATERIGKKPMKTAGLEAWFNVFNPINLACFIYPFIFLIAMSSLIGYRRELRWSGLAIIIVVLLVHTFAIGCRVYISGRPPVVNLYSSAVVIGWAGVVAALAVELLYPYSLGLMVGSVVGFLSLLVAYGLETSDTMPVLQAVLDTQFWLATHVMCVTFGYAATFFAGMLGIGVLAVQFAQSRRVKDTNLVQRVKILDTVTYGTVCFALFFSFVGTVLGGLWGDDSWGRFWGWDPKENGALMIVLWNAILLHARWDKQVKSRGFALLAIGGNIVTAWSWFGTNQLGIGLHSYGFTNGVLMLLGVFVLSQLGLIIVGFIVTGGWDKDLKSV